MNYSIIAKMVHPAFDIRVDGLEDTPAGCRLLIEISGQSLNYIWYVPEPFRLIGLRQYRMYTTGDGTVADLIREIISGDEVLQGFSGNAVVVYNFPDAALLPGPSCPPPCMSAMVRLTHGDSDDNLVFEEQVPHMDLSNVYCIPKDIHSLLEESFRGCHYRHIYTLVLAVTNHEKSDGGSVSKLIFYNDKFIVTFYKNGILQLIQTFCYQTPEDVAYYLLLICKQFGILQQEMMLHVSGLIDNQSALNTELLKYFPDVDYETLSPYFNVEGPLEEYPAHYFSPLLKMSVCVS